MIKKARIAPPNSLLLLMDVDRGDIPEPESMDSRRFVTTPSCVAIGTLMQADGETTVTLTDEGCPETGDDLRLAFSGAVLTPQMRIDVCTVLLDVLISLDVMNATSNVEIWTNHATEPDRICIIVESSEQSGA
jgi:hypothetical protein